MTALSQGCTVIVSDAPWDGAAPEASPTYDAAPEGADAAPTGNDCNACLVQACEDQWSLCTSSSECMAIYTCATAPSCVSDTSCVTACYNAHPQGQKAYDAISSCDQNAKSCGCATVCSAAPSSSCSAPDAAPEASDDSGNDAGVTCASCAAQSCANENAACAPATSCDAYGKCLAGCADTACIDQCASSNAAGKGASDALAACLSQSCAAPCGLQ